MWLFYDKCDMGLEWEDGMTDNGMLLAARTILPEDVGSVHLSLHKPSTYDSYVTMRCRIYPHMGLKEIRCDMTMPMRIKDIWTAKKKAEFFLVDALKERQEALKREVMQLMDAKSKLKNVSRAISA